jgi:apolipoprotein N-acyltransferase
MWLWLTVAISAAAFYFGTGLGEVWPLAWVAPIPVLVFAFRSGWRQAALAAFASYYLGNLGLFVYGVMPAALVATLLALIALVFSGVTLAARYAAPRLPAWAAPFVFPSAWTSYEFLLSLVSPHGTALSLAYSQAGFLPLIQAASVAGMWIITFLLLLVPSAIAVYWRRRKVSALAPALVILFAALCYGALRLTTQPQEAPVRVGLAATDRRIGAVFDTRDRAAALEVVRRYAGRVARLGAAGAQVVVLPEKFVGMTPDYFSDALDVLRRAAVGARVTLVAGFNRVAPAPPRNVAEVIAPDGEVLVEYDKRHMLPGPETGYVVGAKPGLFTAPGTSWGVAICKDMDFPGWPRRYGRDGVRLLAVPAWDFVADGKLHFRMALMRGVENGFAMARAAQQGLLTLNDAYGRIIAETPSGGAAEALLTGNLPPGPGATFYTRWGDWFGWVNVTGAAALMVWSLRRKPGGRRRTYR